MLRVPISQAAPGMKLAVPVQHPQRGTMLLSEGFELDAALIRKLAELEIPHVWVVYPDTEQIKQYVSPSILHQQSQVISTVADLFDHLHRDAYAQLEFANYRKSIQGLIESLVAEPAAASYIVEMGGAGSNDLRHSSEVCFLSLLLGLKLQGYLIKQRKRLRPRDAKDVISLGLGAMLHDIGKTALDPQAIQRHLETGDDSDPQWRQHTLLGHRMLSGTIPPAAAGVILHHHQYFDGSGFPTSPGIDGRPCGLRGDDIHVFARIVCVANIFDHLRHPHGDGNQPRVRILKDMLTGPGTSRFDPVVLATLPLVVPAYPPGSIVRLSDGRWAVVVAWHPEAPCQPTVQPLAAHPAKMPRHATKPVQVDLRQATNLLVIEHDGIDVRHDNFRLIPPPEDTQKSAA